MYCQLDDDENFGSLDKEDLMESNKLDIRERLIQALDNFGVGNEMYEETNESLADYLIEVIDELSKWQNNYSKKERIQMFIGE